MCPSKWKEDNSTFSFSDVLWCGNKSSHRLIHLNGSIWPSYLGQCDFEYRGTYLWISPSSSSWIPHTGSLWAPVAALPILSSHGFRSYSWHAKRDSPQLSSHLAHTLFSSDFIFLIHGQSVIDPTSGSGIRVMCSWRLFSLFLCNVSRRPMVSLGLETWIIKRTSDLFDYYFLLSFALKMMELTRLYLNP